MRFIAVDHYILNWDIYFDDVRYNYEEGVQFFNCTCF